jgi:hypothetical protein
MWHAVRASCFRQCVALFDDQLNRMSVFRGNLYMRIATGAAAIRALAVESGPSN